MKKLHHLIFCSVTVFVTLLQFVSSHAQTIDSSLLAGLKWRMIGPFRGGRTVGACGVTQQPNVFYIGVNNGGVWKTTDYGRTWKPVFDEQPTGSIGDVEVAPSNPDVVYVGTGEGLHRPDLSVGNGIYKSIDAGVTWHNTGLSDGQQVGKIAIDPKNENRVFAAVLGHPYNANKVRGVYRTIDGGKTWEQVLFIDENTGAIQVEVDPENSDIIYADMWESQLGPWENSEWDGAKSGLYKSTDGGTNWKKIGKGLPTHEQDLGRIGFCIAPTEHNRIYATVTAVDSAAGIYRSDDGGESFKKLNGDWRLWGRGDDFAELKVDPKNADIVYDANVVCWKSIDGGANWNAYRGAPGGDDSHRFWINANNPDIILLAGDQGAIITVNGGQSWSSWYNQPTAQLYHVSADNDFPYNVYGGQQESGSVGIASRGNDGAVTVWDWHPVGAEEWGYVCADPLNPNIVYGGKISRYDKRTGQNVNISPDPTDLHHYRFIRTAPVLFSPTNPKLLFYAGNVLFKTYDGGNNWKVISPDLTRTKYDVSTTIGIYRNDSMAQMPQRGVIYTVAPSPLDSNTIWIGTDDGLIQVTRDGGKSWTNVTPPEINSWSKISIMDASHSDVNTAYAAVNRIRLDDAHPHIYKTTDGGKTWKEIVNGLPDDPINVVREDPIRKGLLFAGSERFVNVSFDDGEHWQSLRLNMPCSSIRDLVIKDNDLVIGTHGRSFWILDNMSLLRELTSVTVSSPVVLFKPATVTRVRWDMYTDTPLPQEEPAALNPPDGAVIDYYLKDKIEGEVSLYILNTEGKVVRHYSSTDTLYKIGDVNIPHYWIRPQQILSNEKGVHRFIWDLHYQPLNVPPQYPISAIYGNTAPAPTSPWVMPGTYTVKLIVNDKTFSQTVTVVMDPRVKTSTKDLQQQFDLSFQCYQNRQKCFIALKQINSYQSQIKALMPKADDELKTSLTAISKKLTALTVTPQGSTDENFNSLNDQCATAFSFLQDADVIPTSQVVEATEKIQTSFDSIWKQWESLNLEIKNLNTLLQSKGLDKIHL